MSKKKLSLLLTVAAAVVPIQASAQAKSGTAVMGVYVSDEDTHVEVDTTSKLDIAMKEIAPLQAKSTMTVRQAMAAFGCVSFDVVCAEKVNEIVQAKELVWGTISHSDGGTYRVAFSRFDAATHRITTQSTERVPSYDVSNETLRLAGVSKENVVAAQGLGLSGSAGQPPPMEARPVAATVDIGQITVGDALETSKTAPSDKPMMQLGKATTEVEVVGSDGQTVGSSTHEEMVAGAPAALSSRHSNVKWRKIVGWSSIGVGVAGAAMAIGSAVRVTKFDKDSALQEYRAGFNGGTNVCDAADAGLGAKKSKSLGDLEPRVNEVCGASRRLQALQWVGLGLAVGGTGTGLYFLLKPVVTTRTAGLQFTTRF